MPSGLDEGRLIRAMVLALRERPGQWLTFRRLSQLVAIRDCDEYALGAIAEYRDDLFAISNDRKIKLRPKLIEEIALQGVRNWQIPERPIQDERGNLYDRVVKTTGVATGGCYCKSSFDEILNDLREESVPDEALVLSCCWVTICRVRGLYLNLIAPEIWIEICRRRGYIQHRENPRGF